MTQKIFFYFVVIVIFHSALFCHSAFSDYCDGKIGEVETLTGKDRLWISATRASLGKVEKDISRKSKRSLIGLIREGKVFSVLPGTRVRILECPNFQDTIKVRILDGDYAGRIGWISRHFLK